ncbi:MAG: flagellar motor switch protein FliM [Gemmatimonadaceae bacterium]
MTAPNSLEQADVDRLLGGQGQGSPLGAATRNVDVQVYDFRRPHRISRERQRTMDAMYERLVKSLEGWLVGRLRDKIELSLQGQVDQVSFEEFILSLSVPCSSYLVDIADAGQQQGVIDFSKEFGFFLIDRLFGGGGCGDPTVLDRVLTPIERMALRTVVDKTLVEIREIWKDHVPIELAIAGFESIPDIMQAVARNDPVLVANITARYSGGTGLMAICLPLSVFEKFFAESSDRAAGQVVGTDEEREENRRRTEAAVRGTSLDVVVQMPPFEIALRDLLDLRVGTLISTAVPTGTPVQLCVNGEPRFTCQLGRTNSRLAVRLIDAVPPSPSGQIDYGSV